MKRYTVVLIRSCAHSMGDGTGRGRRGRRASESEKRGHLMANTHIHVNRVSA